ncbi:MAG: DUF1489 family protein [Alphaproteobacteria bacterium]|nr:DUF1489 family protein [Alphaproteobacteria bacterium]
MHLLKLAVGVSDLDTLKALQSDRRRTQPDGKLRHFTRHPPRRADEVLDGGSIYWVIRGFVAARQRILAIEEADGRRADKRCALVLDPKVVATELQPRRPHQGWRYLEPAKAPKDIVGRRSKSRLPEHLAAQLRELGLL